MLLRDSFQSVDKPTNYKGSYNDLEMRLELQHHVSELGIYALEETNLQKIVEKTARDSIKLLGIDYFLLFSTHPEKGYLQLLSSNLESLVNSTDHLPVPGNSDISYAFHSSDFIWTPDYKIEKKYRLIPTLERSNISSGVLISTSNNTDKNGVLCLYSCASRSFDEHEIHYLKSIARILGASIGRHHTTLISSKINHKLDIQVKQNQRFQREILNNSIVERWKLGEYLHDNFAQTLASIKITINELKKEGKNPDREKVAKELETIKNLIDKQIDDIRNLSHEIIPIDVEEDGASHAFRLLMKQIQRTHKIKCSLVTDGIIDKIYCRELSTNLYHITQEAIKNAINHGHAKNIQVVMKSDNTHLYLEIQDDGVGISMKDKKLGGMGLRIIQHRVELFSGIFTIRNFEEESEFSTSIVCKFPLETTIGLQKGSP